ncbi:AAA family ATPase [Pseudactinotalea sp. Z1748]|uniref:AAA family ATPase n=1 Tax=Pseudactinotalea sp. Z1748 TaxID=3413027 RepID=UPI003C7CFC5B
MSDIVETEKAIIGALLAAPTKAREAAQHVAPGDFQSPVLGGLYSLIVGKVAAGEKIDSLTLWPAVKADAVLSRNIRTHMELHQLIDAAPTASNVDYYARQVADAGQSRRIRAAGERVVQLSGSAEMTAAEKMTAVRHEFDSIASDYAQAAEAPTLADILARPDEAVEWVIPDVLSRRDRFILTGEEGYGKTTLFRQILICAAAGIHPFTFDEIAPVDVLVVDTENDEDQWKWETRAMVHQAARFGARNPAGAIRLHCTGRLDITKERDLATVHGLIDDYQPGALAIGPLYKLSPEGMNNDKDAAPVIAALDSIRDRPDGPAMLMEAHAPHAGGHDSRRNLRPRGSSMQLGWPEFGVGLGPDPDDDTGTLAQLWRWRGSRIRGRQIPRTLRMGGDWPWMEDGTAMDWLRLKNNRRETDTRTRAAGGHRD